MTKQTTNVNEGHRARLRNRMMQEGLSGFQDHEVLELLLFQYLPRKDTNKLAHDLLNKFGNFANVLDASPQQLMTVKGVSVTTACNISMLKEVWQRYKRSGAKKISLASLGSIVRYSQELIADSYIEKLIVVYVDDKTNYLSQEEFTSGDLHEVKISVKRVVSTAVSSNASGVVLFHCHVGGNCEPSEADKIFTDRLFITLANMNIVLLEHIIFNRQGDYFSFVQKGVIDEIMQKYKIHRAAH